jgi:hypothetical protein
MTTNSQPLTDDLLRRALTELAGGPDGDMLMADVLRAVDSRPQVAPRPWDTRGWRRTAVLVAAAALLVAAMVGTTVVLMRPQPSPPPPTRTPLPLSNQVVRVPDFFVPFTYRMPVGMSDRLETSFLRNMIYSIGSKTTGSEKLVLFRISGDMHAIPGPDGTGECRSIGHEPATDEELESFLQGLDEGPVTRTTLGELPAFTVAIDAAHSACRNSLFHVGSISGIAREPELQLVYPGFFTAAWTPAGTVGALIYAPTNSALAEWLPVAQALLNGLRFDGPAPSDRAFGVSDFVVPFSYRLPVGMAGELQAFGSQQKGYFIDAHEVGGSGRLELLPISGHVHACGTDSTSGIPRPAAFIDVLKDKYGAGVAFTATATLGNLAAVAADLDPKLGTCPSIRLHLDGLGLEYGEYEPNVGGAGRLILAEVPIKPIGVGAQRDRQTIGVWITAPTEQAFVEWLPYAQVIIDSLEFGAAPAQRVKSSAFVVPFTYEVPSGMNVSVSRDDPSLFAVVDRPDAMPDGQEGDVYGRETDADGNVVAAAKHGIVVALVDDASAHPCPPLPPDADGGSPSRIRVDASTPRQLFAKLERNAGAAWLPAADRSVDERLGITRVIDLATIQCSPDMHVGGLTDFVALTFPTELTAVDIDGHLVVIQIWAQTQDELERWLPAAGQLVVSLHFE